MEKKKRDRDEGDKKRKEGKGMDALVCSWNWAAKC